MSAREHPFASDLSRLSPAQREREKALLEWLKRATVEARESESGWRFFLPVTEDSLAAACELLAYERLCCPFLEFHLEVSARELAAVHVFGGEGAKPFIAAEFKS
jgi:hypothetical protein